VELASKICGTAPSILCSVSRRDGRNGATAGQLHAPSTARIPFDTSKSSVICGGAFVGLEEIIAKRLGRGGFGLGQLAENCQVSADGLLRQMKPEELEAFGLISELPGKRAKDMQSRSTVIVARLSGKSLFVPSKP
jgi:ATP-dependent protease Clp ATPase subunit